MNRMMQDILGQAASLAEVVRYQSGEGREALESAARALRDSRRIVIAAMGASLYASMLLDHYLRAMGLPSVIVDAGELLHFGGDIVRDATVVLVSRSGETVELVGLLPKLREAGAAVIGVTNEPGMTLARAATIPVLLHAGRDEAVALQSYTGTAMVALLLSALLVGEDPWDGASGAVAEVPDLLSACAKGAERFRTFLEGARVVYLLGRGASLATAHEGALLFNEASKLPSVAMSSGAFRHGPIEVVNPEFRAFLIASHAGTAPLDDSLRAHLKKIGGQVRTVAASGFFAPVLEIIPLQFAAYYAAELRGFAPGKFRYISQVTTSETEF